MLAFLICLIVAQEVRSIGIMGALKVEVETIDDAMIIDRVDTIGGKVYKVGKIFDSECVLVNAGVGKVASAQTAQTLIMRYDVHMIIFTGVAGGINPALDVGDIVISRDVVQHDFGQIWPDSFVPFDTTGFYADSMLIDIALDAAQNVDLINVPAESGMKGRMPHVVLGRIATGDQFISSEDKRIWIAQVFDADCVEMEGAAVAQICAAYDIPFLIIRSLSDLANENADVDFQTFVLYAAQNSSKLVKEIIKRLME
jgi:adenosylhomocysteine nucleosidase